jgi:hypothetical protein
MLRRVFLRSVPQLLVTDNDVRGSLNFITLMMEAINGRGRSAALTTRRPSIRKSWQ